MKLKTEWGCRAIRYEKSCRESRKCQLVRDCWGEKDNMEVSEGKGKDLYSIEKGVL